MSFIPELIVEYSGHGTLSVDRAVFLQCFSTRAVSESRVSFERQSDVNGERFRAQVTRAVPAKFLLAANEHICRDTLLGLGHRRFTQYNDSHGQYLVELAGLRQDFGRASQRGYALEILIHTSVKVLDRMSSV